MSLLDANSRRALWGNRAWSAAALLGMLFHNRIAHVSGIPSDLLFGFCSGLLAVGLIMELFVFRKPKAPLGSEEIETMERRNLPLSLISALCTWGFMGCFVVITVFDVPAPWFWVLFGVGCALLLVAAALLPAMLRHMQAARVTPELNDERSRANMDRAYRHAFLVMFQVSFLGGVVLMSNLITLPAEAVALGIGLIGMLTLSVLSWWYEWKDAR